MIRTSCCTVVPCEIAELVLVGEDEGGRDIESAECISDIGTAVEEAVWGLVAAHFEGNRVWDWYRLPKRLTMAVVD